MSVLTPSESARQVPAHPASGSLRRPSLIAGSALLLMTVFSIYGVFGPVETLVTAGDPSRTAVDVAASETLFRSGIASLIIVVILDVIVAAALFEVFASVNRAVSMTAAWFRLAYSAVFLVAIVQLLEVPVLLGKGEQMLLAVESFNRMWDIGLVLFAVHLLLVGYLAFRSGFMAKIFGILLGIAGLGYLADGFGAVLAPDLTIGVARFVFIGEVALIFWLLIKGRRTTVGPIMKEQQLLAGAPTRPPGVPDA
ncbi:phosphoglycerol transferase MdoB-like AlkP superfamily enzyme [Arthrobacter sp. PL16]|uniref:DUF4386 domain-containing protein n=1 Tax=Arthrobacter sp. PL16 TaxID=3071720 RepID=UPI002E0210DC|nr:phosphoglycerol transferase MdoB-like AlkP superfamily enzyme [Arthrobacter sp. PL16]